MGRGPHRDVPAVRLPGAGRPSELGVLPAPPGPPAGGAPPRGARRDPAGGADAPGHVWLSARPRPAPTAGSAVQSQDRPRAAASARLAVLGAAGLPAAGPATRGPGRGGRAQSALGVGYHESHELGWSEAAAAGLARLRRPERPGLASGAADHGRGSLRGSARGALAPVWRRTPTGARAGVPLGQWSGVRLATVPGLRGGAGAGRLPDPVPQSPIQRARRVLLRGLQAGLCLASGPRDARGHPAATPGLDSGLQRGRAARRPGDGGASAVLRGVECKSAGRSGPKMTGAVHTPHCMFARNGFFGLFYKLGEGGFAIDVVGNSFQLT